MGERTPGLWHVDSRLQVKSEKRLVANIITGYIPEAEANARFIAAAPDMEAVLERLVYHWNNLDIEARRELMTDARAAITKAKGKADA